MRRAATTGRDRAAAAVLLAICGCGGHGGSGSLGPPDSSLTADALRSDAATLADAPPSPGTRDRHPAPRRCRRHLAARPRCTPRGPAPAHPHRPPATYRAAATCTAPPPGLRRRPRGNGLAAHLPVPPDGTDAGRSVASAPRPPSAALPPHRHGPPHRPRRRPADRDRRQRHLIGHPPNNCAFCRCADKETALVRSASPVPAAARPAVAAARAPAPSPRGPHPGERQLHDRRHLPHHRRRPPPGLLRRRHTADPDPAGRRFRPSSRPSIPRPGPRSATAATTTSTAWSMTTRRVRPRGHLPRRGGLRRPRHPLCQGWPLVLLLHLGRLRGGGDPL
jgi:hypothetical protein